MGRGRNGARLSYTASCLKISDPKAASMTPSNFLHIYVVIIEIVNYWCFGGNNNNSKIGKYEALSTIIYQE